MANKSTTKGDSHTETQGTKYDNLWIVILLCVTCSLAFVYSEIDSVRTDVLKDHPHLKLKKYEDIWMAGVFCF